MRLILTILMATNTLPMGRTQEVNGRLVRVNSVPKGWSVGLPVVFLWSGTEKSRPAVLAHGVVEHLDKDRAVVKLDRKSPAVRPGLKVVARYAVEGLLFGGVETKEPEAERPRIVHKQQINKLHWGETLWLEAVADSAFKKIAIMYRVGSTGPFRKQHMHRGELNHWSGRIKLPPKAVPRAEKVQYFFAEEHEEGSRAVLGDVAHPFAVQVITKPHTHGGHRATHYPSNRWLHGEPLMVRAEIDKALKVPVLHYRAAGAAMYEALPMSEAGGSVWVATIPAEAMVIPGVRYYLSAIDEPGHRHPIFRNAMNPHRVRVVRGRMLDGLKMRNRLTVGLFSSHSSRQSLRYERAFFPFLLSRLAYETWDEPNGVGIINSGGAGIELRLQNFFAATADMAVFATGNGNALGYDFGVRIGDEMGASIGGSYAYKFSLDDGSSRGERLQFILAVPMGKYLQAAGRVDYDGSFSPSNPALRLTAELKTRLAERYQVGLSFGPSSRGADAGYVVGGTLAAGF